MQIDISRADWKSAHAAGALTLPPGASVPLGKLDLRMARLDDLRAADRPASHRLHHGVAGDADKAGGKPRRSKRRRATPGSPAPRRSAARRWARPCSIPRRSPCWTQARGRRHRRLGHAGKRDPRRRGAAGRARREARRRRAEPPGRRPELTSAATVDVPGKRTTLSALQAGWKGQTLRLLAPAHIAYGSEVSVDRLRLGVQQATIDVAGRVSPTLDLTAAIRNVTPDLAKIVAPDLSADGTLAGGCEDHRHHRPAGRDRARGRERAAHAQRPRPQPAAREHHGQRRSEGRERRHRHAPERRTRDLADRHRPGADPADDRAARPARAGRARPRALEPYPGSERQARARANDARRAGRGHDRGAADLRHGAARERRRAGSRPRRARAQHHRSRSGGRHDDPHRALRRAGGQGHAGPLRHHRPDRAGHAGRSAFRGQQCRAAGERPADRDPERGFDRAGRDQEPARGRGRRHASATPRSASPSICRPASSCSMSGGRARSRRRPRPRPTSRST